MNLRGFLMRHPRPGHLRLALLDGTSRTITVDPKIPWVQLAAYVAELGPETIECLGPDGIVLRGIQFADLDDSEDDDALETVPHAVPITARMRPPEDPASQQLVLFAQLLADAYRHTTDVAFDKMISLFEQVNKRYELTEKSLDRMQKMVERLTEQRLAEVAKKEEDDWGLTDLAAAFQGGQAQHLEQQQSQPSHRPPAPAQPRREPPPPGSYVNGKVPHA